MATVRPARGLTWLGLVAVLLAALLAPALVELIAFRTTSSTSFPDTRSLAALITSTATEVAVVIAAIIWLRWWPPVLHEHLRVRRWLWVVPIALVAGAVALTDYAQLRAAGWTLTIGLALGCLLIGAGEELIFRGVVLTFARARYREWVAALVTTVLFAAFHLPGGVIVAIGAGLTGALLYVVRRVSGGIMLPIAVHAMWDFAVFSGRLGPGASASATTSQILFVLSLGLVVLLVCTHRLWRISS